jgi:hypothetical protein
MVREMTNVPLVATEWNHVALVRNGSTIALYRNGVKTGEVTCGTKKIQTNTVTNLYIGCYRDDERGESIGLVAPLKGYLNDFRVTLKNARYTSNFTPPAAFGTLSKDFIKIPVSTYIYTGIEGGYNIYKTMSESINGSGKFMLYRSNENIISPDARNSIRINGINNSRGSLETDGVGRIYGTVTENAHNISCLLRLYDRNSGALVATTRSTESGSYEFKNLKMSTTYTLVACSPNENYNSIIRDMIKPERM